MNLIQKIKNLFKKKPKKLTLEDMITKINNDYHFNNYDENLINAIYTDLLDYGSIKIAKMDEHLYMLDLTISDEYGKITYLYTIDETGMYMDEN